MSSSLAIPSSLSTASPLPSDDAAPIPDQRHSLSRRNLIIIVAVLVGFLVVLTIVFVVVGCRKKSARLRWNMRASTPITDAEFDRWRRPRKAPLVYQSAGTTVYKSSGLRYDSNLKTSAPTVHAFRIDSSIPKLPRPVTPPNKHRRSPTLANSPATSIRPLLCSVPAPSAAASATHTRHKSSLSIHDRPPTPYSPSSPPPTWDTNNLWNQATPTSPREKKHRVHYPSMSESSDFDFGFGYGPGQGSPRRDSARRESWVHQSRPFPSLSGITQPNFQQIPMFGSEDAKQMDY